MFDLQINGLYLPQNNISCDFWSNPSQDQIKDLSAFLDKQGIQGYLATIITDSKANIKKNLEAIQAAINSEANPNLLGVHIEGAIISKLGMHPQEHSESLASLEDVKDIVEKFSDIIRIWTLCPRVDKDSSITKYLQEKNIIVSYGHTSASYKEAQKALKENQVKLVTHWGNAMAIVKGMQQRAVTDADLEKLKNLDSIPEDQKEFGIAVLENPDVKIMIICGSEADKDIHLDPKLVKFLFDHYGKRLILVTDAVYNKPVDQEGLRGGRNTLKKHIENLQALGVDEKLIKHATLANPASLL